MTTPPLIDEALLASLPGWLRDAPSFQRAAAAIRDFEAIPTPFVLELYEDGGAVAVEISFGIARQPRGPFPERDAIAQAFAARLDARPETTAALAAFYAAWVEEPAFAETSHLFGFELDLKSGARAHDPNLFLVSAAPPGEAAERCLPGVLRLAELTGVEPAGRAALEEALRILAARQRSWLTGVMLERPDRPLKIISGPMSVAACLEAAAELGFAEEAQRQAAVLEAHGVHPETLARGCVDLVFGQRARFCLEAALLRNRHGPDATQLISLLEATSGLPVDDWVRGLFEQWQSLSVVVAGLGLGKASLHPFDEPRLYFNHLKLSPDGRGGVRSKLYLRLTTQTRERYILPDV